VGLETVDRERSEEKVRREKKRRRNNYSSHGNLTPNNRDSLKKTTIVLIIRYNTSDQEHNSKIAVNIYPHILITYTAEFFGIGPRSAIKNIDFQQE